MFGVNSSESGADLKRGFYCLLAGLSDYDYKIPNEKTHLPFFIFNLSTLHTQTLHTESVYNSSCFKNSRYETKWVRWAVKMILWFLQESFTCCRSILITSRCVFRRVSHSSWSTVGWTGNTQQREEEQFLRTSWSWAAAVRASNQNPSPKPNHRNAWEQRYVTLAIDLFSCKVWGRVALCNYSLDTFAAQQRSTYFIKLVSSWDGFQ